MVKLISYKLTLPLRSKVLRNNLPLEECIFPTDQVEGAFHLAYYHDGEIATIASLFPKAYKERQELGYQLRGMATDPLFAGKGYGSELIKFAIDHVKKANATYIWCNARTSAVPFYRKLGFKTVSEEFEIQGVGPHFEMILNLYEHNEHN